MIVIELPWPAKEVWPNFRQSHHFRSYAPKVKAQRENAERLTKALPATAEDHATLVGDGRIKIHVEFYPPDRRHRDDDGMIGAFKSARDGIADALNVDDRRFRATYWFMEPCKPGKIVVRLGAGA